MTLKKLNALEHNVISAMYGVLSAVNQDVNSTISPELAERIDAVTFAADLILNFADAPVRYILKAEEAISNG